MSTQEDMNASAQGAYFPPLPDLLAGITPDEWNDQVTPEGYTPGAGWGQALWDLVGNTGCYTAVKALAAVIAEEGANWETVDEPEQAAWNRLLAQRLLQVLESMPPAP